MKLPIACKPRPASWAIDTVVGRLANHRETLGFLRRHRRPAEEHSRFRADVGHRLLSFLEAELVVAAGRCR